MKHLKKFNKYATNVKEDIVNELHKPARINSKRRRTVIKGLNDLIQADLIDLISYSKENNGYNVYSTKKASIVERSIRTIKNMLWRAFSLGGEYKWIHILDDIVDKYNNTVHSTTRMKPVKVTARNERSLLKSTYTHLKIANKITKFKLGDHVRISKYREAFEKGYTPNWSSEICIIRKIRLSNPTTYLLQDEAGKEITGGFYELELQKAMENAPQPGFVEKESAGELLVEKLDDVEDISSELVKTDNAEADAFSTIRSESVHGAAETSFESSSSLAVHLSYTNALLLIDKGDAATLELLLTGRNRTGRNQVIT
ncbi:hypothetical protein NQ315_017333 [Exocentrus adspersus]|uniref:Integrase catalytic domain-containing protein n=1 Tax=Exocentrus adspersus TaxID=1586481 RepID=A0AAV8VDM7_9CUCU|nr:hypothetical protein NQ315_017333 [Exocentrus adspersus]